LEDISRRNRGSTEDLHTPSFLPDSGGSRALIRERAQYPHLLLPSDALVYRRCHHWEAYRLVMEGREGREEGRKEGDGSMSTTISCNY